MRHHTSGWKVRMLRQTCNSTFYSAAASCSRPDKLKSLLVVHEQAEHSCQGEICTMRARHRRAQVVPRRVGVRLMAVALCAAEQPGRHLVHGLAVWRLACRQVWTQHCISETRASHAVPKMKPRCRIKFRSAQCTQAYSTSAALAREPGPEGLHTQDAPTAAQSPPANLECSALYMKPLACSCCCSWLSSRCMALSLACITCTSMRAARLQRACSSH